MTTSKILILFMLAACGSSSSPDAGPRLCRLSCPVSAVAYCAEYGCFCDEALTTPCVVDNEDGKEGPLCSNGAVGCGEYATCSTGDGSCVCNGTACQW